MPLDPDWTNSKKSKYRILKPAFEENRGYDSILRIQWLMAKAAHEFGKDHGLFKRFLFATHTDTREERAQKAIAAREGDMSVYYGRSAENAPRGLRLS